MKGKFLRIFAAATLLAGALALSNAARAEYVQGETPYSAGLPHGLSFSKADKHQSLLNRPVDVWGASLRHESLKISGAGTLSIRLLDFEFPNPLESLSLLVTDLNGLWKRLDGPGDMLINLTGPAKLFVVVFAKSEGKHEPGMYYVQTNFAPVPLPAAVWLLLSGLGGLAFFRHKKVAA